MHFELFFLKYLRRCCPCFVQPDSQGSGGEDPENQVVFCMGCTAVGAVVYTRNTRSQPYFRFPTVLQCNYQNIVSIVIERKVVNVIGCLKIIALLASLARA